MYVSIKIHYFVFKFKFIAREELYNVYINYVHSLFIQCLGHLIDIKVTEHTNALKRFKLDDEIINALATLTCTHFVSNISLSNYLLFYYFTIIFMSQKRNVKL